MEQLYQVQQSVQGAHINCLNICKWYHCQCLVSEPCRIWQISTLAKCTRYKCTAQIFTQVRRHFGLRFECFTTGTGRLPKPIVALTLLQQFSESLPIVVRSRAISCQLDRRLLAISRTTVGLSKKRSRSQASQDNQLQLVILKKE